MTLDSILVYLSPRDASELALTCRRLHLIVNRAAFCPTGGELRHTSAANPRPTASCATRLVIPRLRKESAQNHRTTAPFIASQSLLRPDLATLQPLDQPTAFDFTGAHLTLGGTEFDRLVLCSSTVPSSNRFRRPAILLWHSQSHALARRRGNLALALIIMQYIIPTALAPFLLAMASPALFADSPMASTAFVVALVAFFVLFAANFVTISIAYWHSNTARVESSDSMPFAARSIWSGQFRVLHLDSLVENVGPPHPLYCCRASLHTVLFAGIVAFLSMFGWEASTTTTGWPWFVQFLLLSFGLRCVSGLGMMWNQRQSTYATIYLVFLLWVLLNFVVLLPFSYFASSLVDGTVLDTSSPFSLLAHIGFILSLGIVLAFRAVSDLVSAKRILAARDWFSLRRDLLAEARLPSGQATAWERVTASTRCLGASMLHILSLQSAHYATRGLICALLLWPITVFTWFFLGEFCAVCQSCSCPAELLDVPGRSVLVISLAIPVMFAWLAALSRLCMWTRRRVQKIKVAV
jgi:hypothetical protein